jgi:16S rRNA (guanine966-N2)-methyltransferase
VRIVAGEWRGRRIEPPPGRDTRPTSDRVREAWMSVLQPELPGARVLDLFAGSGALGLEALSRGAGSALFVENHAAALGALRANLQALGAGARAEVFRGDAIRFAERLEEGAFDVAFADPPYARGLASRLAEIFTARPFARVLSIEHHRDEPLPVAADETRRYGDTLLSFLIAP